MIDRILRGCHSLLRARHGSSLRGITQCEHRQAAGDHDCGQADEHLLGRRLRVGRDELEGVASWTHAIKGHAHQSGHVDPYAVSWAIGHPSEATTFGPEMGTGAAPG